MAILIKDQEANKLIQTLAARTGESITDAVKQAVRERLERLPLSKFQRGPLREDEIAARKRGVAKLRAKCDAMPTIDDRTPDEIIGYNEFGHFD
jgi:antitoxin VapB